jgi:hypothetical protein
VYSWCSWNCDAHYATVLRKLAAPCSPAASAAGQYSGQPSFALH